MDNERLELDTVAQSVHTRLAQTIEVVLFVGAVASVIFFGSLGVLTALIAIGGIV